MHIKNEIEWIPCKERLPEYKDNYLVVVKQKYDWEKEWEYNVDIAESHGSYWAEIHNIFSKGDSEN